MIATPSGVSGVNRIANGVHRNISRNEMSAFAASERRGHKVTNGMLGGGT